MKLLFKCHKKLFTFFSPHALQMSTMSLLLLVVAAALHPRVIADPSFDVRHHLSTVTSYEAGQQILDGQSYIPSEIPDGCEPIHMNLVARHGSRSPTKKRMKQLETLGESLEMLLADKCNVSSEKVPSWLCIWRSPWEGKTSGGELMIKGEKEHYGIALRTREKFAKLFKDDYHSDIYSIHATQIPRASTSAVAFAMGLFKGKGSFGEERYRAFAITTESIATDIELRFYDTCQNYEKYCECQKPVLEKLRNPVFDEVADSLYERHGVKFTRDHVSSLWFLCKQEASLLDITDQACHLFTPHEVALMEWADDVKLFVLKGYGNPVNYNMGVTLLHDVFETMTSAIKTNEEQPSGFHEKTRLRFAHAETLVPFSCLLGLFLDEPEFAKIQRKEPLQLPQKPPQERTWKGSTVTPFAGNDMLVLYSCPARNSSKYFVQVLHNEHPIPLPGCNNSDFCPFDVFKERIVMPHSKQDFNSVCDAEPPKAEPRFSWLPMTGKKNVNSGRSEL